VLPLAVTPSSVRRSCPTFRRSAESGSAIRSLRVVGVGRPRRLPPTSRSGSPKRAPKREDAGGDGAFRTLARRRSRQCRRLRQLIRATTTIVGSGVKASASKRKSPPGTASQTRSMSSSCGARRRSTPRGRGPSAVRGSCATHSPVFVPAYALSYADDRSSPPPTLRLEKYLAMLDNRLVLARVLVPAAPMAATYGGRLARRGWQREPRRVRGVAVADSDVSAGGPKRWHALGCRVPAVQSLLSRRRSALSRWCDAR